MGEWDNTAFLATADTEAVADALAKLIEASGRTLVDTPRTAKPPFPDPMQYGTGATSSRWAAAVLAGKRWTIIKTAPFELLCEGDGKPRLALLAEALGCDAFQLNIYDGDSTILVEANAQGDFRISGFNAATGPGPFHGFEIDDAAFEAAFGLIAVPPSLPRALALGVAEGSRRVRELLHGDPDACDNLVQVEYLIQHEPLANAIVLHADRTPARPVRDPLVVPLVVERTEEEARFRLQLPAGELWLEAYAGVTLAPRTSREAPAILDALASWLAVPSPADGEALPKGVGVFGELVDGDLSIGDALPIGIDLDEARGKATLREIDPNVALDLVTECAHAWTGNYHGDVLVPHVERLPLPPHRAVACVAAGDCFVIATSHELRTVLWTWRPGEPAAQIADVAGRLEQLARGPKRDEVTLRVGHGLRGHGSEDERDIFVFELDGTRYPILDRIPRADTFAWSPDGERLCVEIHAGKGRSYLQLFDATGVKLARSPDTLQLAAPRWVGPLVYCRRSFQHHVTWRPSDNAVEPTTDWLDCSPTGIPIRGNHEATWIGDRRIPNVVRAGLWTDPLVWLDDTTCILARDVDEEARGQALAVDITSRRARPVVASDRATPCGRLGDVFVINDGGWRLWWGRVVAR